MSYGYGYYPQDPVAALLAPARRASVMMFILAAPLVLCGAFMGLIAAVVKNADPAQLSAEQSAQLQAIEQKLAPMGVTLAGALTAFTVITLVIGVLLIVLGVAVRRGGMGSVVGSIIVCCLLGLFAGLSVFGGIAEAAKGQVEGFIGMCFWGVALVLLVVALVSLFQAARNAGQVAAYRGGMGMGGYPQGYPPQGYGQAPAGPIYPSQQPQTWQQPGVGPWGQPNPPMPPPPPPPSDRQG
jgi:hypothetical protein